MTERFNRIIVILDGGPAAERAIPVASALAAQVRSPVKVVRVVPRDASSDDAEAYLSAVQRTATGVTDWAVLSGVTAADALVDFLGGYPRALLCCTTHAHSGLGELLLGSVAEEMMRRSPVPVLLVGPHAALPATGDRYQELIVCVEDDRIDPATSRLLPIAQDLCLGATLHPWLFRVLDPSTAVPVDEEGKGKAAGALPRLTQALAEGGVHAAQQVIRAGDVAQAISFFSGTLNGPIVAVSSHPRSLSERMREGSVAVDVARIAPSPLLVIGPNCTSRDEMSGQGQTSRGR